MNMKRLVSIILGIYIGCLMVSARDRGNLLAEKGYVGNVGVSVSAGFGIGADLLSSHGYSFGNGLWIGGGSGLSFPSPYDLFLPLYSEVKYSFCAERRVSPFLSARLGAMTNFEDALMILSPALGVDIKRFTVFATMNLGLVSMRTYGLGFCWNFGR